jgi:long-subunit fatty acid transport protein
MSAALIVRAALLAVVLALGAAPAFAQLGVFFNRPGSGARAAGMANAFIAVSDDGTAASWNPSGLAQLRKPELSVVTTTIGDRTTAAGFRTRDDLASFSTAESSYNTTSLDFASLAVPVTLFSKPVTFQGAWRRIYALDYRELVSLTRVPLAQGGPPPARFEGNTDTLGSVDLFSAAVAAKLTSHLSLGGSVNFWRGDWTDSHVRSMTPLDASAATSFDSVVQTSRVRGENVTLGLLLTYPRWSTGLVYQAPLSSDFGSSAEIISSETPGTVTQPIDGELHFPQAWGVGGAWRPGARWTVALDLTWDDWTEAFIDSPQFGHVSLFDSLPPDRSATRDTWSVNGGAERLFAGDGFVVPLRFGVAWEPQGGRDPYTRDPVDFVMLALGTGYNTNSLKFDAAFQYRWASFTTGEAFGPGESTGLLPSAVGERSNSQWRLKLSLIVRITDTGKLKRTLGKVFG